jgi:hypothetical protein
MEVPIYLSLKAEWLELEWRGRVDCDRCDSVEWKQFVVGTADPEVWPLKMAIVSRDTSRDSCPLPE